MIRSAIRSAVYERTGLPTDDGLVTAAFLNGAIQQALDFYSTLADWPWLQETISVSVLTGTPGYAVPADWSRTRFLRIDDSYPLRPFSLEELYTRWTDDASVGRPSEFAIDDEGIVLRPTPDQAYTMIHGYLKTEPVMTDDANSPLLPVRYHYAIVEYASWLALRRTRDEQRAQEAKSAFDEYLRAMRDDRRRTDGPIRVRVRPGGWI